MDKSIIGVVFGGKSSEYEVSLASAYAVLENIDKEKYEIQKIGITRDGKWYLFSGENEKVLNDSWWQDEANKEIAFDINAGCLLVEGKRLKIHKILPILHGEYGEDGRIQSLFEMMEIDYSGCGSSCSFASMDKDITKKIAQGVGVMCAKGITIYKGEADIEKIHCQIKKIGYPVVVKPSNGGSSVGVSIIRGKCQIKDALDRARKTSEKVIIEKKINGKEIEMAVLFKDGEPYFSTLGEIGYEGELYSYDEKYKNGKTEYIIPAKISKKAEKKIRKYAKRLLYSLDIRNLCRMDFFVVGGRVYFNEVNTMPGFTEISMFPKLLINDKIEYKDIINYILNI